MQNMSENQALYDEKFIEEEEYSFDTAAFEALRYATEHDSDSEFSEENEEENDIYNSKDSAIPKNIIISEENDEVITQINVKKNLLTPCVLIDIDNGELCCCGSTKDLRRLWQLVGMWEVDGKIVDTQKNQLENLGVCYKHFLYDQNQLHES